MGQSIDDELFKRLVLLNQYLILEAVDHDNREGWHRAARDLEQHRPIDELPYVDVLHSYGKSAFTEEMRSELLDTLDLFEVLQDAEDAGKVPNGNGLNSTSFPGYSGNEEGGYLSYYRDLVKDGQRWPSLRRANPKDLNSHFPVRDGYARMVGRWIKLGQPRHLSQDQFNAILYEWVHPENR